MMHIIKESYHYRTPSYYHHGPPLHIIIMGLPFIPLSYKQSFASYLSFNLLKDIAFFPAFLNPILEVQLFIRF